MRVLILGHKGNMGRRYAAILDWMRVEWVGFDTEDIECDTAMNVYPEFLEIDRAIICTPTLRHYTDCLQMINRKIDYLCEKPISKEPAEIESINCAVNDFTLGGTKCFMVNNWAFLSRARTPWTIVYNYYNTGRDGLYWDLIQPLYLSGGKCLIVNKSPVFDVYVNGQKLTQLDFDWSYIQMVKAFVDGDYSRLWTMQDALRATEIVLNKIKEG